jgi:hypothetical protein
MIHYRPDILELLSTHGLRPTTATTPAQLRRYVHDVYLYEIRQLRDRCRAGEFPRSALAGHVVELRKRYRLLSLPEELWVDVQ